MLDNEKPPSQQIEGLKMQWQTLHSTGANSNQRLLDNLAAIFMLCPFGRPGVLFDSVKWLKREDYQGVLATRENHQYLASIAVYLFRNKFTDIHALKQIINFIRDFDVVFTSPSDLPYTGEFQGVLKFNHFDFRVLRQEVSAYLQFLYQDSTFQTKVKRLSNDYNEAIETLSSVLELSQN